MERMDRWAVLYCCGFFILVSPGENTTSYVGILWKLRLALVVCIVFLNEEYLIALVGFKETAFGLCRLFFYKESAFGLYRLYWLHQ